MFYNILHPELRNPAHKDYRIARIIAFAIILLFLFYLFYMVYFLLNFPITHLQNINNFIGLLLFFAFFAMLRFTPQIKWSLMFLNLSTLPLMYISIYNRGGLYSADIIWMILSILSCIIFIDIYFGVVVSFITFSYLGWLYYQFNLYKQSENPFINYVVSEDPLHYLFTWIFVMIIISVILISFTITLKRTNRKLDDISKNKIYLLEKELSVMTKSISDLRSEISKDFHDEMGNKLASIGILAETLQRKIDADFEKKELTKLTSDIQAKSREVYEGTKDFIWTIDWKNDFLLELYSYIGVFSENVLNVKNINFSSITNITRENNSRITPVLSRQFIFIYKEIITNSLKHSECTEVELSFQYSNNMLYVIVMDNGIGFNPDEKFTRGVQNIKHRASKIKAQITITSKPTFGGVKYEILFPLTTQNG